MNYRSTKFYKDLTLFIACETVEWSEDATEDEIITAWQWLVDTRHCWNLQGWYGRNAEALIDAGIIKEGIDK